MRPSVLALLVAALVAAAHPAEAVKRRAFVTSVTGTGNLSSWPDAGGQVGLSAGDQICRARAAAGGLANANTYRAWLSTATTDAYCHVQGLAGTRTNDCEGGFPTPAGPWFGNGTFPFPVTGDLDRLTDDGVIYRPMLFDEFGVALDGTATTRYWTGTRDDGTATATGTCSSWTSGDSGALGYEGHVAHTAQVWSYYGTSSRCDHTRRLLCLEPGASEPTGQTWPAPASIVFVTSARGTGDLSSWPQAGGAIGLAAGDAVCRNVAAAAHLPAPDSFVAWLSKDGISAADRLTSNGPYRRIDGVAIAGSKASLLAGSNASSIHQDETGAYLRGQGGGYAWTGTDPGGQPNGLDCAGWTSASNGGVVVARGAASTVRDGRWTESLGYVGCGVDLHLYCFSNVVTIFWDGFEGGDASRWSGVAP